MYLASGIGYWTMSPGYRGGEVYVLLYDGRIAIYDPAHGEIGIRPVITLKQGTEVAIGDGTMSNPYKVL